MIWAFEGEKEIKNANICRQWVAQILGLLKETKHSKMSVCVTLPVGWGVDLDAGSEERERDRECACDVDGNGTLFQVAVN